MIKKNRYKGFVKKKQKEYKNKNDNIYKNEVQVIR